MSGTKGLPKDVSIKIVAVATLGLMAMACSNEMKSAGLNQNGASDVGGLNSDDHFADLTNKEFEVQEKMNFIAAEDEKLQEKMLDIKDLVKNIAANPSLDIDDIIGGIIPGIGDFDGLADIFDDAFVQIKKLVEKIRAESEKLVSRIEQIRDSLGNDPQSAKLRERIDQVLDRLNAIDAILSRGIGELQNLCEKGEEALEKIIAKLDPSKIWEALAIAKLNELVTALESLRTNLGTL